MRFELEFEDTFEAGELDRTRWLPYYLPHWSTREQAAARYEVGGGRLRLQIAADQRPWCPELDGDLRVSSLQTGLFAGPVGSGVGQHRFRPEAIVREALENVRLYTPRYGRVEARMAVPADPSTMAALWLIGYEDEPERSGELCVCEIFGRDVAADQALVGMGIHPFGDPRLVDDFARVRVPVDARALHVYAAEWAPGRTELSVDGEVVKTSDQAPDYPLQLMLGIYELPEAADPARPAAAYPKELVVDHVRGYRLAA